jgi:hypothetical protein
VLTALWEGSYEGSDLWLPLIARYPNEIAKRFGVDTVHLHTFAEVPVVDPSSDF